MPTRMPLGLVLTLANLTTAPCAHAHEPSDVWTRALLTDPAARCLDGSPGALYVKPGVGENATKFVLFFEGGGFCVSAKDCAARAKTPRGSSSAYPERRSNYVNRDLLNPDCTLNAVFCSYASVYMPYCDGTSRAGNADAPGEFNGQPIWYRGHRILVATLNALLGSTPEHPPIFSGGGGGGSSDVAHAVFPTLTAATHILITGSSSGGLSAFLHADYIADRVRALCPHVVVKAVPEVGFFVDGASVWGGERVMGAVWRSIVAASNATGGAALSNYNIYNRAHRDDVALHADCLAHTHLDDRWRCFLAQHTYPFVATPLFVLNSMVDEWQMGHVLAPDRDVSVRLRVDAAWAPCIRRPGPAACNATQWAAWRGYSGQFLAALRGAIAATPSAQRRVNGGFITSCAIHTTAVDGASRRIRIGGRSMLQAVEEWWMREGGAGPDGDWTIDVDFPGDATCPGSAAAAAEGSESGE